MSTLQDAIQDSLQVTQALAKFEPRMQQAADLIRDALLRGHKLLVCGNGGSAGHGGDFTTEFTCRFRAERRPFPAMNLSDGPTLVTAIGNDYGYENVYSRQVEAFGKPGDVCVGISTSGHSANVKNALMQARKMRLHTMAMLGRGGGSSVGLADLEFIIPSEVTARVQEAHKFLFHVLCEMVDPALASA